MDVDGKLYVTDNMLKDLTDFVIGLPDYFNKYCRMWACPIREKNEWFGRHQMTGKLCAYDHHLCKNFRKPNLNSKSDEAVLQSVFDSTKVHCQAVQREFTEDGDGRWFLFHRALMIFLELRCGKRQGSGNKKRTNKKSSKAQRYGSSK